MFKVVDVKSKDIIFECETYEEAVNMVQFFDEDCRIEN